MKSTSGYYDVERRCFEMDDVLKGPDGGLLAAMEADEVLAREWEAERLPDDIDDCLEAVLRIWHDAKREAAAWHNRRWWALTICAHNERIVN